MHFFNRRFSRKIHESWHHAAVGVQAKSLEKTTWADQCLGVFPKLALKKILGTPPWNKYVL
jgi:hypothetical protein